MALPRQTCQWLVVSARFPLDRVDQAFAAAGAGRYVKTATAPGLR